MADPMTDSATNDLKITHEPEFPGQVVWECGAVLGIARDEATARAAAAAIYQEVEQ